jgi:hypothetical protein
MGLGGQGLIDRLAVTKRGIEGTKMKTQIDMSLWSIIERLQRRLERQGLSPANADRTITIAIRHLAMQGR